MIQINNLPWMKITFGLIQYLNFYSLGNDG